MIDIRSDQQFIAVEHRQEYDASMNNHSGGNKLIIDILPGYELTQLKETVDNMKLQLDAITIEQDTETALRKTNPALQELYDQYQMVYTLVKKTDDAINGNNGG